MERIKTNARNISVSGIRTKVRSTRGSKDKAKDAKKNKKTKIDAKKDVEAYARK